MSQISSQKSSVPQSNPSDAKAVQQKGSWLYAFWKFSRPHTIIGTSLSVLGLYLVAIMLRIAGANALSPPHFSSTHLLQLLGTWISCLCGNIYIVGLNQLEDIEIDQINKPHLPLASGEFSPQQAKIIVGVTGISALLLAGFLGPVLFGMVGISLAIGTAYSLPPIRLKRFPFWAAICIFSVRWAIVNLGLFLHFSWALQNKVTGFTGKMPVPQEIPAEVWALTLFILVFTVAIAIFKDIPDMEGDRLYNITTFTLKLGAPAVFNVTLWVIAICYLGMAIAGWLWLDSVNLVFLVTTHLAALGLMMWRSRSVDLQDKSAIASFYQFIWKLFFLEYLIFPAACLWH